MATIRDSHRVRPLEELVPPRLAVNTDPVLRLNCRGEQTAGTHITDRCENRTRHRKSLDPHDDCDPTGERAEHQSARRVPVSGDNDRRPARNRNDNIGRPEADRFEPQSVAGTIGVSHQSVATKQAVVGA